MGDGSGNPVTVEFADHAAERRLLLDPALALGELYMEGRLVVTRGSIYDLLTLDRMQSLMGGPAGARASP